VSRRALGIHAGVVLLAFSSCAPERALEGQRGSDHGDEDPQLVGRVGAHDITEAMIAARRRHIDQYYPGSGSRVAALAQLVQGYLAVEVLEARGVTLDRATWEAERDRIERDTRAPERLAQLRAVYGDDEASYLYVGVLPDFARARAHRHFGASEDRVSTARARASAFVDATTADPDAFAEAARAAGIEPLQVVADRERGIDSIQTPASDRGRPSSDDRAQATVLIELLADLEPGQVHPRTLETPNSFQAARLLRRRADGAIEVELVAFELPSFHDWFWQEAQAIPIAIFDRALRESLRSEVAWAGELPL
jgi:hypothetical protein